ncbi:hypothetical protein HFP57_16760 [Parasphingopyxis algicola]|uniref:hypothetical protein n=1 Tax=Parasphingopyxis algicola TaxID=2026624 RepID=UPI0015A2A59D|nr:hypothetical protein [Parasphingopyxis algicola]QLC26522.1 hypothetical protein HFP57_16760 [Parasphingopyxis algicola]
MKRLAYSLAALAIFGLATGGLAVPAASEDGVLWVEVCGRPDMRVAIRLGGGDQKKDNRDCAEACHAALCRKTLDSQRNGDARGAVV